MIAPDQTTYDYVAERSQEAFEPVFSDAGASYIDDYKCAAGRAMGCAALHAPAWCSLPGMQWWRWRRGC